MKISDALLIQKDIVEEVARLRELGKEKSTWYTREPDAQKVPTFDVEENHQRVLRLQKLHRKLSKAITRANINTKLPEINDEEYKEFLD